MNDATKEKSILATKSYSFAVQIVKLAQYLQLKQSLTKNNMSFSTFHF
jgi:hypothetical protein